MAHKVSYLGVIFHMPVSAGGLRAQVGSVTECFRFSSSCLDQQGILHTYSLVPHSCHELEVCFGTHQSSCGNHWTH